MTVKGMGQVKLKSVKEMYQNKSDAGEKTSVEVMGSECQ